MAIDVASGIRSRRVIEVLSKLVSLRGAPRNLRSDNGPEFVSNRILEWIEASKIGSALSVATPGDWKQDPVRREDRDTLGIGDRAAAVTTIGALDCSADALNGLPGPGLLHDLRLCRAGRMAVRESGRDGGNGGTRGTSGLRA